MQNILIMPGQMNGCWYYRIDRPYRNIDNVTFLTPNDFESKWLEDELKNNPIIVCRTQHARAVLDTIDKFFPDCKIVVDLDDDVFNVDPYNDSYKYYGLKEVKHLDKWLWKDGETFDLTKNHIESDYIKRLINRADMLTVSTPRLKDKFKHKNIYVNYNAIDFEDWHRVKLQRDKDEIRVGWSGSSSHYSDWAAIQDGLKSLLKNKKIKLVLAGVKFDGTLKDLPQEQVEYWSWVHAEAHPFRSALMDLDVAIIPLVDNCFNRGRSCVKYYEFAALGVPVIASKVPPYIDEIPGAQLFDALETSFYNVYNDRQNIADKQYLWLKQNRDQKQISKQLEKALSSIQQ